MNWFILILLGIAVILLIIFLVRRNLKDKDDFESQLNENYRKSKNEEGDIDPEEMTK